MFTVTLTQSSRPVCVLLGGSGKRAAMDVKRPKVITRLKSCFAVYRLARQVWQRLTRQHSRRDNIYRGCQKK
jgi:hypothetical protein